jgi:hypothetical protein
MLLLRKAKGVLKQKTTFIAGSGCRQAAACITTSFNQSGD